MNRYMCAVCLTELKTPETVAPGMKYVCAKCYGPIQIAENCRADRAARKLAAWNKRQPKA